MIRKFFILFCLVQSLFVLNGFGNQDLEVWGLAIKAPNRQSVPEFIHFVKEELDPRGINTLVLRVDYGFKFKSHPELATRTALSLNQVKRLVAICRQLDIHLIPQINLLGHQSWHGNLGKLLEVFPEFDETPGISLPKEYQWPNPEGLYCKSYCSLHPDIHNVVFALVDEIMEAFEATAFHAGMDEVFYIGHDQCPRCRGKNKATLFADEVKRIHNHLVDNGKELWIWGDRLLDGETTGIGLWEASMNDTHQAIDLIPKNVVICDWHYERPEPTAIYFAMKGFKVVTCPWRKPEVALSQYEDLLRFKQNANPILAQRYAGMMQTVWSSAEDFIAALNNPKVSDESLRGQVNCFNAVFKK